MKKRLEGCQQFTAQLFPHSVARFRMRHDEPDDPALMALNFNMCHIFLPQSMFDWRQATPLKNLTLVRK